MMEHLFTLAAGIVCMGMGALCVLIYQAGQAQDANYRDHYAVDPAMTEFDPRKPEDR